MVEWRWGTVSCNILNEDKSSIKHFYIERSDILVPQWMHLIHTFTQKTQKNKKSEKFGRVFLETANFWNPATWVKTAFVEIVFPNSHYGSIP